MPFHFQVAWSTHPSFKQVVQNAWSGNNHSIFTNLNAVKQGSLDFNAKVFGNIFAKKRNLEIWISAMQKRLEVTDVLSLRIKKMELNEDYNCILLQEELFWFQKSREQWVRFGDRNTKFFHLQTLVRRRFNKINELFISDGSWSTDSEILQQEATSLFKNLFCSTEEVEVDCLGDVTLPCLSAEACETLTAPVTLAEVKAAVFSTNSFKALGSDGFQTYFFKEYWEIVGVDIWQLVKSTFRGNLIDTRIMETLIVLIPKVDVPSYFKDFRLLVCVMWSIRSSQRLDSFAPRRGLQQGDPMSSYLFILCMERLAGYIANQVDSGLWDPVAVTRGGPRISHLMFADDLLLFCKARKSQVVCVMHALQSFCRASGMKINLDKSKAMCSKNVNNRRKELFTGVSSIRFTQDLGKYLGVNLHHARVTRAFFNGIVDKIKGRLANWKGRLLNRAGRLCLINSVAASIPTYRMQVSLFPSAICDKITSLWKGTVDGRGLSLTNWNTVVTPKKFGGLGIRDTACANVALIEKLIWQLFNCLEKLWVQLIFHKYLKKFDTSLFMPPRNASHVWRSICKAFNLLRDGFTWNIGPLNQSFWFGKWRMEGPLAKEMPYVHISDFECNISDFWEDGQWKLERCHTPLPDLVKQSILLYNPDCQMGEGAGWRWSATPSNIYSSRNGYLWLCKRVFGWEEQTNWLWLWQTRVPKKGLGSSDLCPRYNAEPETISHCLRECPKAKAIWHSLNLEVHGQQLDCWLRSGMNSNAFLFSATIWWIWRDRNNVFNPANPWRMGKVIALIHASQFELHKFLSIHHVSTPSYLLLSWSPPTQFSVKVNCDASIFGESVGFGCVCVIIMALDCAVVLVLYHMLLFFEASFLQFGEG
ncbi:uncharacterized protein LOC127745486 [Arachis duranensis]|uniref:Uncharacterized protein LOC127745486 n=1 Tax=Arachis duranensis TaxID=130453 RepID=A0A9C6TCU5_ARADU|nr:uncharacterized protein LOC127745486 [Arachis duranensis]